ncbi:MAG TPA: PAS domain S-box protein [Geobacteraceae bacterium]|nr:PAS domain S-box protein [Geobacteraceae bacterium]
MKTDGNLTGASGESDGNKFVGKIIDSRKATSFTLESITDAVFWMTKEGRFCNVNNAACVMLDYSRAELLSLSVSDINPYLPQEAWQRYWEKLKDSENMQYEVTLRAADERVIPVEIRANYFRLDDAEYSCAIVRDITARQGGEQDKWKYRMIFDRMLNGLAICAIICDEQGRPADFRFLEVNPAFEGNTGISNSAATGRTIRELQPETELHWFERFGKVALTGEPMSFIAFHRGLDRHFQTSAFSLGRGEFAMIINDISERVKMEQVLLESESREKARASQLSALMEAVPAAVLIAHDAECKLVTGNQAAAELLRMPVSGNFSKSAPDGESPAHYRIFRNGVETPSSELPVQRAARGEEIRNYAQEFVFNDGVRRFMLGNATPLYDDQGHPNGAVSAFVEITELKKVEKALRESEELFRTLCDSAPIGIFKSDREGNNIYSNRRLEEISGLTAAESLGQGWKKAVHPDDFDGAMAHMSKMETERDLFETEFRLLPPSGKTVWTRVLVSPIKSHEGEVTGFVGTVEDITELRQVRQEMLKTQKLESLGVLAGGIAHDFNNILTAILGNISLARMQLNDAEKAGRRLVEAENAAARARDLTQQLLTFARGGEPVKKTINIGDLLREAAGFAIHGSAVMCVFDVKDDLRPVEVDDGQMSQVIHNLVINAVQAMPGGGTITVGAANVRFTATGKWCVRVSVADTGTGIPEQHLQRIFDPYFTTKQQGSGLGLATCYSIINKHGGSITVESAMGKGSVFHIELPASENNVTATETRSRTLFAHGNGRLLLMDDEEPVRETVKAILEELGYRVECASDGSEAVELYSRRRMEGTPFAAVILDLTVPGGVGGKEAIALLRSIDPEVKAVVSSGYSTDPVMANYREHGFSAVLCKPYHVGEMSRVLQELRIM